MLPVSHVSLLLSLISLIYAVSLLDMVGATCRRFFTSTSAGKVLTRINRSTGQTKNIGKWVVAGNAGGERVIDTLEWNFRREQMYGLEKDLGRPDRPQRFVKVNRQKPRGANINPTTFGDTGRFDLKGMAIDGNDRYYTHSLETKTLYSIEPTTGALTELFSTGLENVLDLAFKMDTREIWAVTATQIFVINPLTQNVTEFRTSFVQNHPQDRLVAIAINPVQHVPVALTRGNNGRSGGREEIRPSVYNFQLTNNQEVYMATSNITDASPPSGGTIQCKRRAFFNSAPSAAPTTKSRFPSSLPSAAPSEDPGTFIDVDPFQVTLDYPDGETVNETEFEATVEDYILSQQNNTFVANVKVRRRGTLRPRRDRRRLNGDNINRRRLVQTEVFVFDCRITLLVDVVTTRVSEAVRTSYWGAVENDRQLTRAVNRNDAVFVGSPPNVDVVAEAILASSAPSSAPSSIPSTAPSVAPSSKPTALRSSRPSSAPSSPPSVSKSARPTAKPSSIPSPLPTNVPSAVPVASPSALPTRRASSKPSRARSNRPSRSPSKQPAVSPSRSPSNRPSPSPSNQPAVSPSRSPSNHPLPSPSEQPTISQSERPSDKPSPSPSKRPTAAPSSPPSPVRSERPTTSPTRRSSMPPSRMPSKRPTASPSRRPSKPPSPGPSVRPTGMPTKRPSIPPSPAPSERPSPLPTDWPSSRPSPGPSPGPSILPSPEPSSSPSTKPSAEPSGLPMIRPSGEPTREPKMPPPSLTEPPSMVGPTIAPTPRPTSSTDQPTTFTDEPTIFTEEPTPYETHEPTFL